MIGKTTTPELVEKDPSQVKAPILEAMEKYAARIKQGNYINFMDLGHKSSSIVNPELVKLWGAQALEHDFYPGMYMDTLQESVAEVQEALNLATKLYGTKATFFSTSGTTPLVAAMLAVAVGDSEKVLIPRHMHKSALFGLVLSGATPVYIEPFAVEGRLLQLNNTPEQIEEALNKDPEIKAVLVVSPTMHGIHADIAKIEQIVHNRGKVLIVDEAWGSLMPFSDKYPQSAIKVGADLVVHSNHKDGPAVVSCGLLHVCTDRINPKKLKRVLDEILTTSPSFWQLSAQDACRQYLGLHGNEIALQVMNLAQEAREEINKIPGFYALSEELCKHKGCFAYNPNRVVVFTEKLGLTGWEVQEILMTKYNIGVGYPTICSFTPVSTYNTPKEHWNLLIHALIAISKEYFGKKGTIYNGIEKYPGASVMIKTPRQAKMVKNEVLVPLKEPLHKVVAQTVHLYPPGIPVIVAGERMNEEVLEFIVKYVEAEKKVGLKGANNLLGLEEKGTKIYIFDM